MYKSCVYAPKKGAKTFYKFEKEFGYDLAWKIYGVAVNPKFKKNFENTLSLDAEGIPSFDSLMENEVILGIIGSRIRPILRRNYPIREDSIENYNLALEDAKNFNKGTNKFNKRFTAIVTYNDDGNLVVDIVPKNNENDQRFANQYATYKLNKELARILESLGVTVGLLTDIEQNSGRVGVTDFSIAKQIAHDSVSMIRIANNMEGAEALSEEFSHLIVGALRNQSIIQRTINFLSNEDTLQKILGNDYQSVYDFYEGDLSLMAEEALGQILQSELLKRVSDNGPLVERSVKFIQNKFKRIKESDIGDALNLAETTMSDLAKSIFDGTTKLTKSDIANSKRDVVFNALSNRIDRNIEMLKDALSTEAKRYKIINNDTIKEKTRDVITDIRENLRSEDTTLGVLVYAKNALNDIKSAYRQLGNLDSVSPQAKFKMLLGIRTTIQSYGEFISKLNDASIEEESENENDFLRDIELIDSNGSKYNLSVKEVLSQLNDTYKGITRKYLKVAIPAFAEYLRPILGDEITLELGDKAGTKVTVEELLKQSEGDISFLDRWLDSMGNSSDILLRAFDKVYKQAVDSARLKSIHDFRRIQELRIEAESYGIKTFEWMFEKDNEGNLTGDYISEINFNQYTKDRKEFEDYLDKKYGVNAKGDALEKKFEERDNWLSTHTKLTIFGERVPNETFYRNKEFDKLTDKQKLIRKKFLELKEEMDNKYPSNRVAAFKAIQLRKDGVQRFIDSSKSPSSIWENIKEHIADEFIDRADDDELFGDRRRSITDFTGREFMTLPVLYTTRLENPNELSTDIFGSLLAYTAASNNYEALDSIIDPLEVGRSIVTDVRKAKATRGKANVLEKFGSLGVQVQNYIYEGDGSNIEKRLDDFFESQLYHRYFKDSGIIDVLGTKLNKNKLVNYLLKGSSLASLGFNYLSNIANVLTGIGMQNIEAASGEFFNARELAKADGIYLNNITSVLGESNSRTKSNKLSLFAELFNIRQDFEKVSKKSLRKSPLARIFNSDIAYLGQACGDHWLYSRTAIAMALREKVYVPNKGEMSLWEALEIVNFGNNDSLKELILPEGTTDSNGKPFDIGVFGRKIAHVNQNLFGIYNTDDRNAAQRVIAGRLLLQFRNWMKPQFNRRFQKSQLNLDTGTMEEGYYRTIVRILLGLKRGEYQLGAIFENLSTSEKANIRRAIAEMTQLLAIVALVNLVEWPDDKDRPWALKLAEYSAKRLEHELGNLAPSPIMLQEMLKTVKSPAASIRQVQNLTNLTISIFTPTDWVNELERGPYKGMTTLERNLYNSGLPIISQYKQLNRMIYDIDNSINYYARPY